MTVRVVLYHFDQFGRPRDAWQPCRNFGFGSRPKQPWQPIFFGREGRFLKKFVGYTSKLRPAHYSCKCFQISYTGIHNLSKTWVEHSGNDERHNLKLCQSGQRKFSSLISTNMSSEIDLLEIPPEVQQKILPDESLSIPNFILFLCDLFTIFSTVSAVDQNRRDHRDFSAFGNGPWPVTAELIEMVQ